MLTIEQVRVDLQKSHSETQSWRKTAKPYGIFPSMARMIAEGYEPGKKIRDKLKLPPAATVIVMGDGIIPNGTQAISAQQCVSEKCGHQWYLSNHPLRTHCFICRPFRRRKRTTPPGGGAAGRAKP